MKEIYSNISIVGGGLIGAATAYSLSKLGNKIVVFEQKAKFNNKKILDKRTTAISEGTKKFLQDESINYMYGIEGGAALHFIDEQPDSTIRFKKNKNAYKVSLESNKVNESPYQVLELD